MQSKCRWAHSALCILARHRLGVEDPEANCAVKEELQQCAVKEELQQTAIMAVEEVIDIISAYCPLILADLILATRCSLSQLQPTERRNDA